MRQWHQMLPLIHDAIEKAFESGKGIFSGGFSFCFTRVGFYFVLLEGNKNKLDVSGRGRPINLSCLWKRQETAQLLCLPLCHNWYNTQDKDLTSSICLLLHSTPSHSPTPHPNHFSNLAWVSVFAVRLCLFALGFLLSLSLTPPSFYSLSAQTLSFPSHSSFHWLQWLRRCSLGHLIHAQTVNRHHSVACPPPQTFLGRHLYFKPARP